MISFLKTFPRSKEFSVGKAKINEFPTSTLPFSNTPCKMWQEKWGNVPTPKAYTIIAAQKELSSAYLLILKMDKRVPEQKNGGRKDE